MKLETGTLDPSSLSWRDNFTVLFSKLAFHASFRAFSFVIARRSIQSIHVQHKRKGASNSLLPSPS
ncbi:hypothetical protein DT065_02560 [Salicibibacter kimchii]|uniref:Uncharacterized protein n=1 Tax=Salicibibacter kimchii TaxID=2099786 RepID=A0A345BVM1_9BACI|nr:hypothetical protein DT065_02560 [Salicibibacter kimchii]